MAITQAVCDSFKSELLGGIHDLDTDTLKIALYLGAADLGAGTTAYSSGSEAVGTGYTAGGQALTGVTIVQGVGGTTYLDFDDPVWTASTFACRGALIYNASKANRAISALDFGGDVGVSNGTFTIQIPAAAPATAILRLT